MKKWSFNKIRSALNWTCFNRQVREETQRRIEVSENFQKTMDELGTLMTSHSHTNAKLKDENSLMSKQVL